MNDTCMRVTEMVRFSCFNTNIHYHRSKKVQRSAETMSKASEDYPQDQELKVSSSPSRSAPILSKESHDNPSNSSAEQDTSPSMDHCLKLREMHSDSSPEVNIAVHQKTGLKKSQSLGSALNREGRLSCEIDSEDDIDENHSCDHFDGKSYARLSDEIDHSAEEAHFGCTDPRANWANKHDKDLAPDYFECHSERVPNKSIFSIEDFRQLEEGGGYSANLSPRGYAGASGHGTPGNLPIIAKSSSFPNIGLLSPASKDGSSSHADIIHSCKSSEDLNALNENSAAIHSHINEFQAMHEVGMIRYYEGESSAQNLNALPSKDFKIKRIEEWVSMIDLEESNSLEDLSESVPSIDRVKKSSHVLGSASTAKLDSKNTHGMEAAKNYVSSLPATSTSAQLINHGLVVIPFLSALVNLKSLNLSGNAIVRITSGALPRGLHVLNLAKNNIATIEGLRELTRLRALDLSYNRILRIGHGLASCSSLKEVYLAGNKISEVEGLHRLLKLNVLDLRFNKISTAKCLGQLAANYSSLHAINLEGNPAQRNVGDDQLKKYLQSILPHLVYFNKQTIRATSSKEVAERSTRSAITSHHQLDRGLRSEHKLVRKGTTGKASSSSTHGSRVQSVSSLKQSKDRLGRLPPPPSGTKVSHRNHYLDLGSKLLGLRTESSMRRSRSEGNLEAS